MKALPATNCLLEEIKSPILPWQVYQRLYSQSPVSFFFDSIFYRPPEQAYSYLAGQPYQEVLIEREKMYLRGSESGQGRPEKIFQTLRRLLGLNQKKSFKAWPFFTGGALGYWGYEAAEWMDRIRFRKKPALAIPEIYMGLVRDVMIFDHRRHAYYLSAGLDRGRNDALKRLKEMKAFLVPSKGGKPPGFELRNFRPGMTRRNFEAMVLNAKRYIQSGDIYQANLSQRFSFDFKGSPLPLYEALRDINPSPFASFVKIYDMHVVSSSPERLVLKRGDFCETKPIAGTRGIRGKAVHAEKIKKELLSNEKERAEHIMLVDLERNDLGRAASFHSVKVPELMKIEKYSHVMHLVSRITGCLAPGRDALDLLKAMFPGGTITGCPKIRCMQIIDELEPVKRGLYTGSLGYIGFNGDMDMNIIIRTLVLQRHKGWFQVGAGIVHDSDPAREYEETLHKGEALAEALARASAQGCV